MGQRARLLLAVVALCALVAATGLWLGLPGGAEAHDAEQEQERTSCEYKTAAKAVEFATRLEQCNLSKLRARDGENSTAASSRLAFSAQKSTCDAKAVLKDRDVTSGTLVRVRLQLRDKAGEDIRGFVPFLAGSLRRHRIDDEGAAYAVPVTVDVDVDPTRPQSVTFVAPSPGRYRFAATQLSAPFCEERFTVVQAPQDADADADADAEAPCASLASYGSGAWASKTLWKPLRCRMPQYGREAIRGWKVGFFGDSLTRALFWTYAAFLQGHDTLSHFNGYALLKYTQANAPLNASASVQLRWENNEYGNSVMDSGTVLKMLRTLPSQELHSMDAVVLGFGAHDLAVPDGGRDPYVKFEDNLHAVLFLLRRERRFRGPIIFTEETPSVPAKLSSGVLRAYRTFQMEHKVRRLNAIAAKTAAEHGAVLLPMFDSALARPKQSFDGQHYVTGASPSKDVVYTNACNAIIHHLTLTLANPQLPHA